MKRKKVYLIPVSTGKWGLYEKYFQSLIDKEKNIDFYLQILNDF